MNGNKFDDFLHSAINCFTDPCTLQEEEEEIKVITFKVKLCLCIIAQYILVQACIIQHIVKNVKEGNL